MLLYSDKGHAWLLMNKLHSDNLPGCSKRRMLVCVCQNGPVKSIS